MSTHHANAPAEVTITGQVIGPDGKVKEDLGVMAYSHPSRLRTLLGQRRVRGGGILRALAGRGPTIKT